MEIVKDLRILNAISKRYFISFDPTYKYCINSKDHNGLDLFYYKIFYNKNIYRLKYFSGCFYPYLVKLNKTEE